MDVGDAVGGKEAATASASGRSHDGCGVYSRGSRGAAFGAGWVLWCVRGAGDCDR